MTDSLPTRLAPLSSRINNVVQQALDDQRLVGAVILVARQGEIVHRQAAGLADRESHRPMTVNTLFRLASVSKPIVSTAAMTLVARGELQLDDPIGRWLPDFHPTLADGTPASISVRQLLSHTAGLGYRFLESDDQGPYARARVSDGMDASGLTLEENVRRIGKVPLLYAPGTAWGYSLAIDVLGLLIARASGTSLERLVAEQVTGPLEMIDSGFSTAETARMATAYVNSVGAPHPLGENEVVAPFPETCGIPFSPARIFDCSAFPSGGAGMVGTAGDFLRLLEALRQRDERLLPAAWVDEMARDQTGGLELADSPGLGFGLGFSVLRDPQLAASPESTGTWRWGGAYGHSWFVDPQQRLSVVAFTNSLYEGMSGRFVNDLRDAVYGVVAGGEEG